MTLLRIAHYHILQQLGSGGCGEVYLAEDTRLKRKVALKLIRRCDGQTSDQTFREAHYACLASHPNVVAVYDIGEHDGVCYIASEWIEGETLRHRLQHGALPLAEALDIAIAVGRALASAHEVWLIHRDVKPENILIGRDGRVKLADFSIATQSGGPEHNAFRERVSIAGTLGYLSPEQIRGDLVDQRSDLFSLGVVLYEMLSGRPPFRESTNISLLAAIVEADPPALPEHLPAAMQEVVAGALKKAPHERYATADELVADLRSVRQHMSRVA